MRKRERSRMVMLRKVRIRRECLLYSPSSPFFVLGLTLFGVSSSSSVVPLSLFLSSVFNPPSFP